MVALYAVWYNFVKMHKTLKMTPLMAAGVSKRLWSMEDVVALIETSEAPKPDMGELLVGWRKGRKMASCSGCKNPLSCVRGEHITVQTATKNWNGIAYVCPSCDAVISVEIDPIALKSDIVMTEVVGRLRRG